MRLEPRRRFRRTRINMYPRISTTVAKYPETLPSGGCNPRINTYRSVWSERETRRLVCAAAKSCSAYMIPRCHAYAHHFAFDLNSLGSAVARRRTATATRTVRLCWLRLSVRLRYKSVASLQTGCFVKCSAAAKSIRARVLPKNACWRV